MCSWLWKSSASLFFCLSLVPRPFPPPVFDRILYAKTEGEGFLHTVCDQKLEVGTVWERGYFCLTAVRLSFVPSPLQLSLRTRLLNGHVIMTWLPSVMKVSLLSSPNTDTEGQCGQPLLHIGSMFPYGVVVKLRCFKFWGLSGHDCPKH